MKTKIIIIVLAILLVVSNFIWLLIDSRLNIWLDTLETINCILHKESYCLKTFPLGISYDEFIEITKKNGIKLNYNKMIDNRRFIEIRIVDTVCKKSRKSHHFAFRPKFSNNILIDLNLQNRSYEGFLFVQNKQKTNDN